MEKENDYSVLNKLPIYHLEYPDGRPIADIPFGSLELILRCVLECNSEVVVRKSHV